MCTLSPVEKVRILDYHFHFSLYLWQMATSNHYNRPYINLHINVNTPDTLQCRDIQDDGCCENENWYLGFPRVDSLKERFKSDV